MKTAVRKLWLFLTFLLLLGVLSGAALAADLEVLPEHVDESAFFMVSTAAEEQTEYLADGLSVDEPTWGDWATITITKGDVDVTDKYLVGGKLVLPEMEEDIKITVFRDAQPTSVTLYSTDSTEWEDTWTCYKDQLSGGALAVYQHLEDAFLADTVDVVDGQWKIPGYAEMDCDFAEGWFAEQVEPKILSGCIAFLYDHPEYFWIRYHLSYSVFGGNGTAYTELYFTAFPTTDSREEVEQLQQQIDRVIAELVDDTAELTNLGKLAYMDNWLVENNRYNHEAASNGNSYMENDETPWSVVGALLDDYSPVCEGYAKAFQLFCHEVGIPCLQVFGWGGGAHMWTYAQIGDAWYLCDPTWDDPDDGGGVVDTSTQAYFMVGERSDHIPEMAELLLPTLPTEDLDTTCSSGHAFRFEIVLPTCALEGSVAFCCDVCGGNGVVSIPATGGHIYSDGVCTGCSGEMPADVLGGGSCGEEAFWKMGTDGTLTVFGYGEVEVELEEIFWGVYQPNQPWEEWIDQLMSVVICEGIEVIGPYAFHGCRSVETVEIADTVYVIDDYAFSGCWGLETLDLPEYLLWIGNGAFGFCRGLTKLTLPKNLAYMDSYAFYFCTELSEVVFEGYSDMLYYGIGNATFEGCTSLEAFQVAEEHPYLYTVNGVLYEGTELVQYPCGRKDASYTIPEGTEVVRGQALAYSAYLEELTISSTVAEVEGSIASHCDKLRKVVFKKNETSYFSIGASPFECCDALEEIVVEEGHGLLYSHEGVLYAKNDELNGLLQYPCGKKDKTYTVPDGVDHLLYSAIEEAQYLEELFLPAGIVELRYWAICNCDALQRVFFQGDAPETMSSLSVWGTEMSLCYPKGNSTWEDLEAELELDGVTWIPVCSCGDYEVVITPATCVKQGYTTHTCNVCGDSFVDAYVNDGDHTYENVVTSPTCTEQGYTTHTCCDCGDSYVDSYVDATGHSHTAVVTEPTCTEQGYTTYTCSCGDCYVGSYVDATGHKYGDWVQVDAPSCTEKGSDRRDCNNCDHYETREVDLVAHAYADVVTEPTCTDQGYTTHTCSCGDSYVDTYVNATGHAFSNYVANEGLEVACCDHNCGLTDERVGKPSWRIEDNKFVGAEYTTGQVVVALYGDNGRLIAVKFCERSLWRNENGTNVYRFSAPVFTDDELSRAKKICCFCFDESYNPKRDVISIA